MFAFGRFIRGAVTCVLLLTFVHPVSAGSVSGDLDTGPQQVGLGGGTSSYFAYSRQTKPTASGPNAHRFFRKHTVNGDVDYKEGNDVAVNNTYINVYKGFWSGTVSYGPAAEVRNRPKMNGLATDVDEKLVSFSGVFHGEALVNAGDALKAGYVRAKAERIGPDKAQASGSAAAAAFDPFPIAPGDYLYNQVINASLGLEPDESGGLTFFAVDSRLTDPEAFYGEEEPFTEVLWELSLYAPGPISDLAQVDVHFYTNPVARSLGYFDLAVSDSAMESAVRLALSLTDGVASLTNYTLFPSDTFLSVLPENGTIQFGMGTHAHLEAEVVPELGSWVLTAAAAAIGAGRYCKRRRSATT